MNRVRYESLVNSQSNIAKKVLEAVPITDWWGVTQIVSEVARHVGRPDRHVIEGCLAHLRDVGLVKENNSRLFQRAHVIKEEVKMSSPQPPAENTAKSSIFTRLTSLAVQLRTLADDIDELALDADEELSKGGKEAQQLRQLKNLLKDL